MSYDLEVYARRALDRAAVRELVTAAGLTVEAEGVDGLTVVRGARRTPTFGVGGPDPLEPEDVPDEIVQVVLGATQVWSVVVEGSAAASVPHAVRFARRLATAVDGAVLDQQEGVWSRGRTREVAPVPRGTVAVVDLRWYGPPDDGVARRWLDLARRTLPEALPRRFGAYEPLGGNLDRDGAGAFEELVAHADGLVLFAGSRPVVGGSLSGAADRGRTHVQGLTVLADPLGEPAWRDALQRLFVGFAQETGSWCATAEVLRGVDWTGRGIGYGATAEHGVYLAPRGAWMGLPPRPVWWAWFGPEYADLLGGHLPGRQETHAGGLFHALGHAPADRDRLLATVPRAAPQRHPRFGRGPTTPESPRWLPADLLAVTGDDLRARGGAGPVGPAARVPRALRHRT